MKLLLFDQNLSPRLIERLADVYPDSVHVFSLGFGDAMDIDIWQYAHDHDYVIVTKDADFSEFGIIKELERLGFRIVREGNHIAMQRENPDGTKTPLTMPNHRTIKSSTLRTILSQCNISRDDFLKFYEE